MFRVMASKGKSLFRSLDQISVILRSLSTFLTRSRWRCGSFLIFPELTPRTGILSSSATLCSLARRGVQTFTGHFPFFRTFYLQTCSLCKGSVCDFVVRSLRVVSTLPVLVFSRCVSRWACVFIM